MIKPIVPPPEKPDADFVINRYANLERDNCYRIKFEGWHYRRANIAAFSANCSGIPPRKMKGAQMNLRIADEPWRRTLYGRSGPVADGNYADAGRLLMDEMWQEISEKGLRHKGINHWVYEAQNLLFTGVELEDDPEAGTSLERREILLPKYAYWKHIGPYSQLGAAYDGIHKELEEMGMAERFPAVEVYGHWTEDETRLETEILISVD